jgi:hypothetical protein
MAAEFSGCGCCVMRRLSQTFSSFQGGHFKKLLGSSGWASFRKRLSRYKGEDYLDIFFLVYNHFWSIYAALDVELLIFEILMLFNLSLEA